MRPTDNPRTSGLLNRANPGLSPLQHALLAALPVVGKNPARTGDLLRAVGVREPTAKDLAVAVQSLKRLEKRGLATRWDVVALRMPGTGYAWGRPL